LLGEDAHFANRLVDLIPALVAYKNRFKRSVGISATEASEYRPVRARSRAVSLMSVAKIWMAVAACEILRLWAHRYSSSVMAIE
jgi:hypothetical protein